jgi:hypothetical protein
MKKQLLLALSFLLISGYASAQKEYKLAKSTGRLTLNISGATIEGYNGNEIIFSAVNTDDAEVDERAKGLRAISGSGFTDNTGLGIEVSDKGQEVTVNAVSKKNDGQLTIKVPQGVKVVFNNNGSAIDQGDILVKNLKSEIEISTSFNKIRLENNTGPMNVKSLHGTIDAIFSGEIKGPVSIVSVYGYVDVTMPTVTKANIELNSTRGNLYAADAFKIAIEKPEEKASAKEPTDLKNVAIVGRGAAQTKVNGLTITTGPNRPGTPPQLNAISINTMFAGRDAENIKGKINGGGMDLVFKSTFQNVYLRTK